MAELELEIGAPWEEGVFAEALAAFAELAGEGSGPSVSRAVEVEADDGAMLLVEWLSELVYLCEVEQFVPRRISWSSATASCEPRSRGTAVGRGTSSRR
jgi:SHS2 domain-containing protein